MRLFLVFLFGFMSWAWAEEPNVFLQKKIAPMINLINQSSGKNSNDDVLVNKLTTMVLPIVDEAGISKSVTGKYWNTASPSMQTKFSTKFVRLIIRSFIAYITAGDGVEAKYRPASGSGKMVTVNSQVRFKTGEKWSVDYLLSKNDEGWLIEDITLDGLSLVSSYREQFKPILNEKGFDGLYQLVSKVAK